MRHRHLEYDPSTPLEHLESAAIVDLLDRGDLAAWKPLLRAIRREPCGQLAQRVVELCSRFPMYGTSPLWREWIERCRARVENEPIAHDAESLAAIRRASGFSQIDLAQRIGMSQSDLSKFERRDDVRISTLRSYVEGLGAKLELCVREPKRRWRIRIE